MSERKVQVKASIPGGLLSIAGCRDFNGTLYAAYYDSGASPKASKLATSSDDGVTWSDEPWSQSIGAVTADGGSKPVLLVDQSGHVWMVTANYDGTNSPHMLRRNPVSQDWGSGGAFQFFSRLSEKTVTAAGATFSAALDNARIVQGMPNIIVAFQDSGDSKVYVAELQTYTPPSSTHADLGSGTEPRAITGPGGYAAVAFRDGTTAKFSNRSSGQSIGDWTAPVTITDAGDSVTSVEAIAIDDHGNPAVLYRYNKAGTNVLKLVEVVNNVVSWEEVTDGTDRESHPGCTLAYDEQGSVFVMAIVTVSGQVVPVRYEAIRALGSVTWNMVAIESAASATSQATRIMRSVVPNLLGYKPMQLRQNMAGWYLKNNDELWWYMTDPHPGTGTYPTIFQTFAGDLPYRPVDANTRSSHAFTAEGAAATTFPDVTPQTEMRVSQHFETSTARFEAGYVATIARFHTGRRVWRIQFAAVDETDKDALVSFLKARLEDGGTFTFTTPDDEESVDVFISAGQFDYQKVGPSQWSIGQFFFTQQVVA